MQAGDVFTPPRAHAPVITQASVHPRVAHAGRDREHCACSLAIGPGLAELGPLPGSPLAHGQAPIEIARPGRSRWNVSIERGADVPTCAGRASDVDSMPAALRTRAYILLERCAPRPDVGPPPSSIAARSGGR